MRMFVAGLACPIVGFSDTERFTAHRVNIEGLPFAEWETATHVTAVCGAAVKLFSLNNDGVEPLQWKHMRTRGTPVERCPDCRTWKATKP